LKIFLSIYGSVLFVFISFLLLFENPNPKVGDTSLFFMEGNSVNLQNFSNLYSLSPILMYVIYGVILLGILVSIKFNKFYLITTIGNLILSIPIFLVHKNTLFFKPFYFTNGITSFGHILAWVWYIYLSLLGVILLMIYYCKNCFTKP
jgi:hypothetical protein